MIIVVVIVNNATTDLHAYLSATQASVVDRTLLSGRKVPWWWSRQCTDRAAFRVPSSRRTESRCRWGLRQEKARSTRGVSRLPRSLTCHQPSISRATLHLGASITAASKFWYSGNSTPARHSVSECSHFLTRPSLWLYLPLKISWWYLKRFKSNRVEKQRDATENNPHLRYAVAARVVNTIDYITFRTSLAEVTRRSAVAERPRDASCHWRFH